MTFNRIRTGGRCDLGDYIVLSIGAVLLAPVTLSMALLEIIGSVWVLLREALKQ